MSTTAPQPGATWAPIPIPPALVEIVMKNREKIEALAAAGVFDIGEGKATVHFKGSLVLGVQVEKWTYQRRTQSTPLASKEVIP